MTTIYIAGVIPTQTTTLVGYEDSYCSECGGLANHDGAFEAYVAFTSHEEAQLAADAHAADCNARVQDNGPDIVERSVEQLNPWNNATTMDTELTAKSAYRAHIIVCDFAGWRPPLRVILI